VVPDVGLKEVSISIICIDQDDLNIFDSSVFVSWGRDSKMAPASFSDEQ
jgi:hypothetical protein